MTAVVRFEDVVGTSDQLMGVKAVWGRSREGIMCFGARGDAALKDRSYYSQARVTAEQSQTRPYFVTIGGGKEVPNELQGRVLELVRSTGVYGETEVFVRDNDLRNRLAQWPVAVVVSEVYLIRGEPHLMEDLGFPDRRMLTNAFDRVIRDDDNIKQLWRSLKGCLVERRWEVTPPPGFRDPGIVRLCGSKFPTLRSASSEGKRIWLLSKGTERDPKLRHHAMELNRENNNGVYRCEACQFSDAVASMFDAHHLQPLAVGVRVTRVDDLAVLCPTCHRWAHAKAKDKLSPVGIPEVARSRATRPELR